MCSRAEQYKIIYQSVLPGIQMSLEHAENKIGKPKKKANCAGQKRSTVIFVEAGNILDWFKQTIGTIWQWSAI